MRLFCSVCKDIFIPYSEVKITSCGHLYHGNCISRWFKQKKTCPQCRTTLKTQPFKVYFDVEKENDLDVHTLQHQVETLADKLRESENFNKDLKEKKESSEAIMRIIKTKASNRKYKHDLLKSSVEGLKEQVSHMLSQEETIDTLKTELNMWKEEIQKLKSVNELVSASSADVKKMLECTPCTEKGFKQLCTFLSVLKSQADKSKAKNVMLGKENRRLERFVALEKKKSQNQSEELLQFKNKLRNIERVTCTEEWERVNESFKKPNALDTPTRPSTSTSQVHQNSFDSDVECIFVADKKNEDRLECTNMTCNATQWESMISAGPSRNFEKVSKNSRVRHSKPTVSKSFSFESDEVEGRRHRSGSPVFGNEIKKKRNYQQV